MKAPPSRGSHRNPEFVPDRVAQKFQYEVLDSARNEIRLLRIKPAANPEESIRCQLFHTSLEDAPPYRALSYAWGERASSHAILINQGSILVTPNLKHALERLRPSEGEDLIMWVDALCINQQDIPERNVQTGKMRMIYRNAERVSVWLGRRDNGRSRAFQLARDLCVSSKNEVSTILQDSTRKADIESLVRVFRIQYWWRIWVVQEAACSKNSTVHYGSDSIAWETLENVIDIMREHEHHLHSIYYNHLSKSRTLTHGGPRGLQLSRYSSSTSEPPLLELLLTHKSKNSTDPRDKVYALVGISSSQKSFGPIDYSLSMRDVFTHTARHIITSTKRLDVICVKQQDENQYDLPSWVPNWTRAPHNSGQTRVGLHNHDSLFLCSGDTLASFSFPDGGLILRTKGILIDHIKAVGVPFKKYGAPSEFLPAIEAFTDWRKLFVGFRDDSLAADAEFARTISCGNWRFESDDKYYDKLKAITSLSERHSIRNTSDSDVNEAEELNNEDHVGLEEVPTTDDEKEEVVAIIAATLMMNRRRFLVSGSNRVGLAPWDAEIGDMICILFGCRFPVILRPRKDHYTLIGEAYVDGIMDGELFSGSKGKEFSSDAFDIR